MILYDELAEDYYSIESNNRNIPNDIYFIRSFLPQNIQPQLLDIGCGTGEHLGLLSRESVKCTGIDISEAMINVAKKRNPSIEFIKSDMINFDFYEKYDLVMSLFGSLDYFTKDSEIETVLWNTRRALKPGGIAVFEIWNAIPILKIRHKDLGLVSTTFSGGKKIKRERGFNVVEDEKSVVVRVDYKYTIDTGNTSDIMNDVHIMRAYRENEFDLFAENNGFKVIDKFSDTLKTKVKENTNKLIYVLQKF